MSDDNKPKVMVLQALGNVGATEDLLSEKHCNNMPVEFDVKKALETKPSGIKGQKNVPPHYPHYGL